MRRLDILRTRLSVVVAVLIALTLSGCVLSWDRDRPRPEGEILYLGNDGILRNYWGESVILVDKCGRQGFVGPKLKAKHYQERLLDHEGQ